VPLASFDASDPTATPKTLDSGQLSAIMLKLRSDVETKK
jgi:hypothetical protein